MVAGWMLYFVLVSALLIGAGLLLEDAARRVELPQRWIWAAAMGASTLLPLAARLQPLSAPSGQAMVGDPIPLPGPTSLGVAPTASFWTDLLASIPPLDPLLIGLWGGATGILLLLALLSLLRLRGAMRGWSEAESDGPRILVSEGTGPAVIGAFPGAIVLPRWAVTGDPAVHRLMLSHEEEHLRARDPALLLAAAALVVLLPWNVPLWWQLRRLRLAVEVDCDARVLRRGSDLRSYATLLLEVGRRRAGLDPALLAFAEPASFLERRIRLMTTRRRPGRWVFAAGLAALAMVLVAGACQLKQPTAQADPEEALPEPVDVVSEEDEGDGGPGETPVEVADTAAAEMEVAQGGAAPGGRLPGLPGISDNPAGLLPPGAAGAVPSVDQPQFTPRDEEPELRNRQEFGRALESAYPSMLKDAGIGGRVLLWVRVGEEGEVTNVRVYESSGRAQLDEAAMHVMRSTARFTPAMKDGAPVPVWIALPVTFQSAGPRPPAVAPITDRPVLSELPPRPTDDSPLAQRPAFTPREVEPELRNRSEFSQALERLYPAALKEAGIGGRVLLWIFVTEEGSVANVQIYKSSGQRELDEAASRAMQFAEFSPAKNRGETVPVWVAVPVTFTPPQQQ